MEAALPGPGGVMGPGPPTRGPLVGGGPPPPSGAGGVVGPGPGGGGAFRLK